jgi:non-canonical purine NTP pyrophosphatase (RdgB/HAM1 family)
VTAHEFGIPGFPRTEQTVAVQHLVLATGNAHKVQEIRAMLGEGYRYGTLKDFPAAPLAIEDGGTFAENAEKKARSLLSWLASSRAIPGEELFVLADDSGLEVDALQGAPGVHSARFAALDDGRTGNSADSENNAKLLRLLAHVPPPQRSARFRCALAWAEMPPDKSSSNAVPRLRFYDGTCEGHIAIEPSGTAGFGYDPLFIPNGFHVSFAELGENVKNRISHRAKALAALQQARTAGVRSASGRIGRPRLSTEPLLINPALLSARDPGEADLHMKYTALAIVSAGLLALPVVAQNTPAAGPAPSVIKPASAITNKPPSNPEAASVLKTQQDRVGYAVGVSIGQSLKRQNYEINPDMLGRAVADILSGKQPLLDDTEARSVYTSYQTELRTKAEMKRKELGEKNKVEGERFLAANKTKEGVQVKIVNVSSNKTAELQYKVLQEGTGPIPGTNDTVVTQYRGTFPDGKEFDSSSKRGQPAEFPVTGVIKGWTEALQSMKVGSKWQLYLPPELAYGERGFGQDIGPNAALLFELELIGIKPKTPPPAAAQPVVTSDIIKVPSQEELKKGAKIEVIKASDLEKLQKEAAAQKQDTAPKPGRRRRSNLGRLDFGLAASDRSQPFFLLRHDGLRLIHRRGSPPARPGGNVTAGRHRESRPDRCGSPDSRPISLGVRHRPFPHAGRGDFLSRRRSCPQRPDAGRGPDAPRKRDRGDLHRTQGRLRDGDSGELPAAGR